MTGLMEKTMIVSNRIVWMTRDYYPRRMRYTGRHRKCTEEYLVETEEQQQQQVKNVISLRSEVDTSVMGNMTSTRVHM